MFCYFYWRIVLFMRYLLIMWWINELLLDMRIKTIELTFEQKIEVNEKKVSNKNIARNKTKKKRHRAKITDWVFWRKSSDYASLANPLVDLFLIDRSIAVGTVAECHTNDIWNLKRTSNICHHFAFDWSPSHEFVLFELVFLLLVCVFRMASQNSWPFFFFIWKPTHSIAQAHLLF